MKNIIIKLFGVSLVILITLTSCDKWIDTEMNQDPNNPEEVSLNIVLPTVEAGLAYNLGGDFSRPVAIWMQQLSGVGNQTIAFDVYNFTQSDVDNVWRWGMYAGPLKDLKRMLDYATEQNSPHYKGIAQILMAYGIGTMTDLFGDMPYSQAWNDDNREPAYDSQQSIYATINTLLNEAIVNLAAEESNFSPAGDDLVYGGDLEAWTRAAYAIKARFAIHLAKVNGATAYNDAIAAVANSFTSNDEDMFFNFGENANEWSPMYQYFQDQRVGDIVMGAYFVEALRTDPRFDVYVDTTGAADDPSLGVGSDPGQANGFANPGADFIAEETPVQFITYAEIKFIEAEARLQTGDAAGAATAYNDAVLAALAKVGVSDAAWETANANETAATITLEKIINQKYIALFMQPEAFTDYRRTGFPALTPPADAKTVNKQLPRRWPYPTSERDYNGTNYEPYKTVTISTPLWWDK